MQLLAAYETNSHKLPGPVLPGKLPGNFFTPAVRRDVDLAYHFLPLLDSLKLLLHRRVVKQ